MSDIEKFLIWGTLTIQMLYIVELKKQINLHNTALIGLYE